MFMTTLPFDYLTQYSNLYQCRSKPLQDMDAVSMRDRPMLRGSTRY